MREVDLENSKNLLLVLEVKDEVIVGSRIKEKQTVEIKARKEYIEELRSLFNQEETYLIPFDPATNTVIEI